MAPAVCILGRSGTGKTTFIERLLPELKKRGFRVAVVKHSDQDVDWDQPGKDTWRLAKAGGDAVVLCTPQRVMANTLTGKALSVTESLRFVGPGYDLVLVEGFHENQLPKIEVHRRELGQGLVSDKHGLMAAVTDEKLDITAPQFSWDDASGVADLIVRKLLSSAEDIEVGLFVGGEAVRLNPFVQEVISATVRGMVSSLKGVTDSPDIDLWIRKKSI